MNNTLHFYDFMHKQVFTLVALSVITGPSYICIGSLFGTPLYEMLWYSSVFLLALRGFYLYKKYENNTLSLLEKERWLKQLNLVLYLSFVLWTIIFVYYVSSNIIEKHYIAIATQLGTAVVASAMLASQKKLVRVTIASVMLPLAVYFIMIAEQFSYLLAIFTIIISLVLLYASNNTYNYLVKSQLQAYTDYLTKLGNRRFLLELLEETIIYNNKTDKYSYLLLIDLDYFKTINDTLGHDIGDELLCEVAERMLNIANSFQSKVARLGGDEFCVLGCAYDTQEQCLEVASSVAEHLLHDIKKSYHIHNQYLHISASIGLSIVHNAKMNAHKFIKEADIAMYEVKTQGRDGVIIFNSELSNRVQRKLDVERHLHFALQKSEISLQFQPQFFHQENAIACEVLVRWNNSELGFIGPDEFIPIAEQTSYIIELGYYILEESFKTLQAWSQSNLNLHHMSINISVRQIFHDNFISDVTTLATQYLTTELVSKITFEITESTVAEDLDTLIIKMKHLKEMGFKFSMDDFGTGYSSLNALAKIPIDELKIDKSFIMPLNEASDLHLVHTILDIAQSMKLRTVAEGVETSFQKALLIKKGCNVLQGYYFSKPLKKTDFEAFFQEKNS